MSAWSLGFGGSGHDWSVCAVAPNGELVFAEEAAFSRRKYGIGASLMESAARRAVLDWVHRAGGDIGHVVACDLVPLPLLAPFRRRVVRIGHHYAHALAAFHTSPFERAAVLVCDRGGSPRAPLGTPLDVRDVETTSAWEADGERGLSLLRMSHGRHALRVDRASDYYAQGETDDSLGELYGTASEELGFVYAGVTEDGKTMALAAAGDERFRGGLDDLVAIVDGQPRIRATGGALRARLRELIAATDGGDVDARRAAVAREVQRVLERCVLALAADLRARTTARDLALAGGVFLNCLANTRLAAESGFERVFVVPAAGDAGTALGSAVHAHVHLAGRPAPRALNAALPHLGVPGDAEQLEQALREASSAGFRVDATADAIEGAALALERGAIVAWCEGRSELGPRALGHRSLFADPRQPASRERMNAVIKRRERFRPFAPAVLAEAFDEVFEAPEAARPMLPFMLAVARVRPAWRERIPAVSHLDGTARVQVVGSDRSPSLAALLRAFARRTGVPVLMNTSFNITGEPIVETPLDAVRTAARAGVDRLVLEGRTLVRDPHTVSP